MATEKNVLVNAQQVILGENDDFRSCTLLFKADGVIVVPVEGLSSWTALIVIVALALSLIGLFVNYPLLFLGGLTVGIAAGFFIGLFDVLLRRRRRSSLKRLDPSSILRMNSKNFEIPFTRIIKVQVETLSSYPAASYLVPHFQDNRYRFDFVTDEGKQTFVLDESGLQHCLDRLRKLSPKTEIEGVIFDKEKDAGKP